jgi:NAD(P)-dependent dehydrogenase (short-subunit alcohol dehydrogenase family)
VSDDDDEEEEEDDDDDVDDHHHYEEEEEEEEYDGDDDHDCDHNDDGKCSLSCCRLDVTDVDSVRNASRAIASKFTGIDFLINNVSMPH